MMSFATPIDYFCQKFHPRCLSYANDFFPFVQNLRPSSHIYSINLLVLVIGTCVLQESLTYNFSEIPYILQDRHLRNPRFQLSVALKLLCTTKFDRENSSDIFLVIFIFVLLL